LINESLQKQLELLKQDLNRDYKDNFMLIKKELLDYAFMNYKIKKVAELGCVWGVDCAYGLYVLNKFNPDEIVMVDTHWTKTALKECKKGVITEG
jgi:hypothetical protein